jgi:hypothetical protein
LSWDRHLWPRHGASFETNWHFQKWPPNDDCHPLTHWRYNYPPPLISNIKLWHPPGYYAL